MKTTTRNRQTRSIENSTHHIKSNQTKPRQKRQQPHNQLQQARDTQKKQQHHSSNSK